MPMELQSKAMTIGGRNIFSISWARPENRNGYCKIIQLLPATITE
jgi:hypothetical protein